MNDPASRARAPAPAGAPRAAATLVLVREGAPGLEVLLLRRAERGDYNSGAWVFPGGLVEARDRDCAPWCAGLDDAAASARLGLPADGLAYYVAALRECFEECGLLLAEPAGAIAALAADASRWRAAMQQGDRSLAELCAGLELRLAASRMIYLSHWLTPIGQPKRFDTRFFVAEAPPEEAAVQVDDEIVEQQWLAPAAALARGAGLKLMTPTVKTLEAMLRFDSVAALMAWARGPREIALTMPRMGSGGGGKRPVTPDEPAWAELGRIDPEGRGVGSYQIVPGVPVRLSDRVIRVSADNGSIMTGPGTNSYLVGGGPRNEWAAIDPGPSDAAHVEHLLAAAPGPIRWILVTHTHSDHSPAAALLRQRTGAELMGRRAEHPDWQDAGFAPDRLLAGGERLAIGEATTLRVIHTPGHASNHLCYLLEEEKTLFTGDHVMQSSTVVINPPDGDMAAYLASLRSLLALDLDWLAPGHGFLMAQPAHALQSIIEHRLRREAKVVAALRSLGPAPASALLAAVYDDVPPLRHAIALRSLEAHLVKLRDDGRATEAAGSWRLR